MADISTTVVNFDGLRKYLVTLTGISDGTGEVDATKVAIDQLTAQAGNAGAPNVAPGSLVVESVKWAIQGYTSIRFYWDTPEQNDIIILTPGEGFLCWGDVGLIDPDRSNATIASPGNVVMTTAGHSSGDTYSIELCLRKKGVTDR